MYIEWCFSVGCVACSDAKGSFGSTSSYKLCPFDDLLWSVGSEPLPVSSWHSFLNVWKKHFPKLKIRNQCEDVCGKCVKLRHYFNRVSAAKRRREHVLDDSSKSSISSGENNSEYDFFDKEEFPEEYLYEKANEHVVHAQAQRKLAQDRSQEAKDSKALDHEHRR